MLLPVRIVERARRDVLHCVLVPACFALISLPHIHVAVANPQKTIAKRTQYAFPSFLILPQDIAFWNDSRYRYSVLAKTRLFPLVSH